MSIVGNDVTIKLILRKVTSCGIVNTNGSNTVKMHKTLKLFPFCQRNLSNRAVRSQLRYISFLIFSRNGCSAYQDRRKHLWTLTPAKKGGLKFYVINLIFVIRFLCLFPNVMQGVLMNNFHLQELFNFLSIVSCSQYHLFYWQLWWWRYFLF